MFENKVCIVTGAAQGIGKAIVERFASQGALMVYALDMNEQALKNNRKHLYVPAMNVQISGIPRKFWNKQYMEDRLLPSAHIVHMEVSAGPCFCPCPCPCPCLVRLAAKKHL